MRNSMTLQPLPSPSLSATGSSSLLLTSEEEEETSQNSGPSKKQILFIKSVFYMLGCGFLLPWNSFISAESYFLSRFIASCHPDHNFNENVGILSLEKLNDDSSPDSSGSNSDDGSNFMSSLALLYNLSGILALACLLMRQRAKEADQLLQQKQHLVELQERLGNEPSSQNNEHYETDTFIPTTNHSSIITDSSRQNQNIINGKNTSKNSPQKSKQWNVIVISLSIYLLIMILTSAFVLIPSFNESSTSIKIFKISTFICIFICGANGAFLSSSIVSYANMYFPPMYSIQCYISGQAVGGVALSTINILLDYFVDSKNEDIFWNDQCLHDAELFKMDHRTDVFSLAPSCHNYNYDWGAFSYFVISCVFLIMCIILFIILDSSPIMKHFRHRHTNDNLSPEEECNSLDDNNAEMELTTKNEYIRLHNDVDTNNDEIEINSSNHEICTIECKDSNVHSHLESSSLLEPLIEPLIGDNQSKLSTTIIQQRDDDEDPNTSNAISYVWHLILHPIISIFVTFSITLSIFPGWTSMLESVMKCQEGSSRLRNDLFAPCMVVFFNVFDLLGRLLSGTFFTRISEYSGTTNTPSLSQSLTSKKILVLAGLRLIFLPAFYLCKNTRTSIDLFESDAYTFLVMIFFALTNGLVSTLGFIHAATLLSTNRRFDDDEAIQRVASTLLNSAVGLGLLSGSIVSFLYTLLV